jgi:hypothetical protein
MAPTDLQGDCRIIATSNRASIGRTNASKGGHNSSKIEQR